MSRTKTDWRAKLHPSFFDVALVTKTFERRHREISAWRESHARKAPRRDVEARRKIDEQALGEFRKLLESCETQIQAIQQRYPDIPDNPRAYSYLYPAVNEEETSDPFSRYLHWMRHRRSLTMSLRELVTGSLKAVNHVARTVQDRLRLLVRRERIKPFQVDEVHRQFLELIVNYQQQPLTAQERADCADAYCGCGQVEHDVDALRKQYARLVKDLDASYAASQRDVGPNSASSK